MIRFKITVEMIQALLKGKKLNYNYEVEILPPQEGLFITRKELDKIIEERTDIVDRLLKLMEGQK